MCQVLVSNFEVGVLKRAVCADVGQRDDIQSADRGHDDEANCPMHRGAEGDHPVLLATIPEELSRSSAPVRLLLTYGDTAARHRAEEDDCRQSATENESGKL